MDSKSLTDLWIMVALILLSAYFSATETAFSALNRTRLKTLAEKGNRKARLTLSLSEQYDKLLSTILIGNNIVNIATASLGTVLFTRLYGDAGATISTVIVTVVVLIFGEITPKSIAKDCPEQFAMFSAPVLWILQWILTPLNFLFSHWKQLLAKLLKLKKDSKMSQDELLMLVEEVQQEGSIDQNQGELLRSAIEFSQLQAEDILTHRVDLEAVPLSASKEAIAQVFSRCRFSRLLVYEESIDHIVGVLHQKDFYTGAGVSDKPLETLITPAIFVLRSQPVRTLLHQLQGQKSHMAVVLDEYGGTYGIVTMEDILEELVGEIWDEHDEVVQSFQKIGPGVFLVEGSVSLLDFCEFFQLDRQSEMVSFSGWIGEQLGRLPQEGDQFYYQNLTIIVRSTAQHRVLAAQVAVETRKGESDGQA